MEVDLEYPIELHDKHNNLPLAPENIVTDDTKIKKLTPNLNDKNKYVLHIRNLQYYLE